MVIPYLDNLALSNTSIIDLNQGNSTFIVIDECLIGLNIVTSVLYYREVYPMLLCFGDYKLIKNLVCIKLVPTSCLYRSDESPSHQCLCLDDPQAAPLASGNT